MNELQQQIARQLLNHNTERLKYLITVLKPHKRKSKTIYSLGIVVNNIKNVHHLILIKVSDGMPTKDKSWNFEEIQLLDAKSNSSEDEFEITFNNKQTFKWIAGNRNERRSFVELIKQVANQLPLCNITFLNVDESEYDKKMLGNGNFDIDTMSNDEECLKDDTYQALTSREEADLELLLGFESDNSINNAEAFTEKLARDLSSMDSTNIQDIIASENEVSLLMERLKTTVDDVDRMLNKIGSYESILKNVRDIVQKIEKTETNTQVLNENNQKVQNTLQEIISKLDYSSDDEYILIHCDLKATYNLPRVYEAARKLEDAIFYSVSPAINSIHAINEQKAHLQSVAHRFGKISLDQLVKIFASVSDEYLNRFLSTKDSQWIITEHTIVHEKLTLFGPLIKWLKSMDEQSYALTIKAYTDSFTIVYSKEFSSFFETLKQKCLTLKSLSDPKRRSLVVNDWKDDPRRASYSISISDTYDATSNRSSEMSVTEWEQFEDNIKFMLATINPICLKEQQFCINFFDLNSSRNSSKPPTPVLNKSTSEANTSVSNQSFTENSPNGAKKNDKVRSILANLFKSLETEFINFVSYFDKLDGIYSIYFLVRLSNSVLSAQDTGSFLSKAYGNIVIHVKRNCDRYIQEQQTRIEEAKDPKGTKVGVLTFVKRFETFAKQTEYIIKFGSDRRSDIDRWYTMLMDKMFTSISRIAKEHQRNYKTPSQMIELENFHYIQNMLASLKIASLNSFKKDAKTRYNQALNEYVNLYFSRPLEKLNVFFEGVQQKVQQGIKEEEISFQLDFNKQELRKVIKDCNLKDIKKGLDEMYKRVEKHVFDSESTLIEVIWHSMQEEFITQYKNIESMIARCYPKSNITLSFSIDDVLKIFSDIAQTH